MAAVQRIRAVVALLDRSAERVARRLGFNAGDMAVLYILNRTAPGAPIRATDLQRSLMNTSGAITKRLDRLQAAALVRREPDPSDGRAQLVAITAEGRALVIASRAAISAEARPRFGDVMTPREWAQLNQLLDRLVDYAQAMDAPIPYHRADQRDAMMAP